MINPISSGLSGLQRQSAAMDRAADKITRAAASGVEEAPATQEEANAVGESESGLVDGTVEMLVARRMFTAAIKVAQTANDGILEALHKGGYDASRAA
jgi:hypothetical protein